MRINVYTKKQTFHQTSTCVWDISCFVFTASPRIQVIQVSSWMPLTAGLLAAIATSLQKKKRRNPQESITFQCKHRFFEVKRIEKPLVFAGWIWKIPILLRFFWACSTSNWSKVAWKSWFQVFRRRFSVECRGIISTGCVCQQSNHASIYNSKKT